MKIPFSKQATCVSVYFYRLYFFNNTELFISSLLLPKGKDLARKSTFKLGPIFQISKVLFHSSTHRNLYDVQVSHATPDAIEHVRPLEKSSI